MYPYLSPTGCGMTPNKELADRMERLRTDYIEAFKREDNKAMSRILKDERELAVLIHNQDMKIERMPISIRVTSYEGEQATPHHLYLDTREIEAIRVVKQGVQVWQVFMKSGREFNTNEDDFNRIERAMRERGIE